MYKRLYISFRCTCNDLLICNNRLSELRSVGRKCRILIYLRFRVNIRWIEFNQKHFITITSSLATQYYFVDSVANNRSRKRTRSSISLLIPFRVRNPLLFAFTLIFMRWLAFAFDFTMLRDRLEEGTSRLIPAKYTSSWNFQRGLYIRLRVVVRVGIKREYYITGNY